jgi:hypothetical protein
MTKTPTVPTFAHCRAMLSLVAQYIAENPRNHTVTAKAMQKYRILVGKKRSRKRTSNPTDSAASPAKIIGMLYGLKV